MLKLSREIPLRAVFKTFEADTMRDSLRYRRDRCAAAVKKNFTLTQLLKNSTTIKLASYPDAMPYTPYTHSRS